MCRGGKGGGVSAFQNISVYSLLSISQLVVLLLAGRPNLIQQFVIVLQAGLEGGELLGPGLEAVGEGLGWGEGGEGGGVWHLLEEGAEGGVGAGHAAGGPFSVTEKSIGEEALPF